MEKPDLDDLCCDVLGVLVDYDIDLSERPELYYQIADLLESDNERLARRAVTVLCEGGELSQKILTDRYEQGKMNDEALMFFRWFVHHTG